MIDAILSAQTNPLMGGVAAFNHQLAKRLCVPCVSLFQKTREFQHPLVSIKASEHHLLTPGPPMSMFFHDWCEKSLQPTRDATRVYAATAALAELIRPHRPDVITAHCPGLIEHRGAFPSSEITVFSFGHGHKLRVDLYVKLKQLLEATGQTYTVFLSAGLHTGAQVHDDPFLQLEALFGDRLIFLGILSDRAVAHYLATCTYVAQFFEHGVRENNTTVQAALNAGARVLTNCDDVTPAELRRAVRDITADFTTRLGALWDVPWCSFATQKAYSWDSLLEKLRG